MSEKVQRQKRWENNLRCCSWQRFSLEDSNRLLFLKFIFTEEQYEILFTDLINTWHERLEANSIELRNKEMNPTVEVPLAKLLHHLEEVLQEGSQGTSFRLALSSSSNDLVITASFNFVGLPFSWKFCGHPIDQKMVCEHLTVPLMTMISHLTYQRDQLLQHLKSKDKEILDLKSQGIQTSRKNLETKIFDETSFLNEMLSSKEFEDQVQSGGKNIFCGDGQKLYNAVMMKSEWLEDCSEASKGEISVNKQTFESSFNPTLPSNDRSPCASNRVPGTTSNYSPSKSPSNKEVPRDMELLRRQQLKAKLAEQEEKEQKKKKKKLKF